MRYVLWFVIVWGLVLVTACSRSPGEPPPPPDLEIVAWHINGHVPAVWPVGSTYRLTDVWIGLNADAEVVPLHDVGYSFHPDGPELSGGEFVWLYAYDGYVYLWYKHQRKGGNFVIVERQP